MASLPQSPLGWHIDGIYTQVTLWVAHEWYLYPSHPWGGTWMASSPPVTLWVAHGWLLYPSHPWGGTWMAYIPQSPLGWHMDDIYTPVTLGMAHEWHLYPSHPWGGTWMAIWDYCRKRMSKQEEDWMMTILMTNIIQKRIEQNLNLCGGWTFTSEEDWMKTMSMTDIIQKRIDENYVDDKHLFQKRIG
ncbi:Hypothetical predicted protein [Mytilus galloprovincialis]|uniref:Uncharacterized protein n=1 Tax=Mytilus galloprovincialis TaxID=29158 RepID=A0A8B6FQ86_MYTGA|nr:Hypothetical predicted protein [Mytilus galloprovincialis]